MTLSANILFRVHILLERNVTSVNVHSVGGGASIQASWNDTCVPIATRKLRHVKHVANLSEINTPYITIWRCIKKDEPMSATYAKKGSKAVPRCILTCNATTR